MYEGVAFLNTLDESVMDSEYNWTINVFQKRPVG